MGQTTDKELRAVDPFDDRMPESLSDTAVPRVSEVVTDSVDEAAQIRSDIEQTRADMSDTIDALQEKLSPGHIAEQVKEQVKAQASEAYDSTKQAVVDKAERIVGNVSDKVSNLTQRGGAAVRDTSSSVVEFIRDNQVAFALIGAGFGMLALNARRTETSRSPYGTVARGHYGRETSDYTDLAGTTEPLLTERSRDAATDVDSARGAAESARGAVTSAASSLKHAATSVADRTREQVTYVGTQARYGAHRASDRFESTLQENPMAVGIVALAAGALVGLALPTTRIEGEYMGEAREQLIDRAQSMARGTAEKVQRVAEEAGRTFKQEAQNQNLASGDAEGF